MKGECCFFPFKYKGKGRHGCLIDEQTQKPWCSLTPYFDKDGKKGVCNKTVASKLPYTFLIKVS